MINVCRYQKSRMFATLTPSISDTSTNSCVRVVYKMSVQRREGDVMDKNRSILKGAKVMTLQAKKNRLYCLA